MAPEALVMKFETLQLHAGYDSQDLDALYTIEGPQSLTKNLGKSQIQQPIHALCQSMRPL